MVFLINYDLTQPGQKYEELSDALREVAAVRILYSSWLVVYSGTSFGLWRRLAPQVDRSDRLLVTEVTSDAAWGRDTLLVSDAAVSAMMQFARRRAA